MDSSSPSGFVVAQPRIPKVIGILNIVFAAGLMACGICMSIYVAFLPIMMKAASQSMKQVETQQKEQVKTELQPLIDEEKAAKTDEERTEIEARNAFKKQELQDSLKRPMLMPMWDMDKMGMNDPKLVAYGWADVVTGLVVNVMMLISGIGLVRFKRWGITLGLWTSGAKILRLLLIYGFFIIGVVPGFCQKMGTAVGEMMQQNQQMMGGPAMKGQPPPAEFFIRTYTIMYTAFGIALIVGGSIYPIICLWLLSRPGARAACAASKELEERGDAW